MTRRERLERKVEKRRDWAEGRAAKSEAGWKRGSDMAAIIPMGQPILVGHHSERRDRNYRSRIDGTFRRAHEDGEMAKHHGSKAAGLEQQLETTIFSDDHDAQEALDARIAELEAKRDRMKKANRLWKKRDAEGLKAMGLDLAAFDKEFARDDVMSWNKRPHAAYELSNLGGNIRRLKQRKAEIDRRTKTLAEAEQAGGVSIKEHRGGYSSVTFAERPEREEINTLKAAGFHWSAPSWYGKTDALPESVKALAS